MAARSPSRRFLDATATAFQDAHPDLSRCPGEERQMDAETFVVPRLWSGVAEELGEVLLALGSELVHTASAPRPRLRLLRRIRFVLLFDDEAGSQKPSQGRVQRAVRERTEHPERLV